MFVRPSFETGTALSSAWAETMALPHDEKVAAFADPAHRHALEQTSDIDGSMALLSDWTVNEGFTASTRRIVGQRIGEVAAARGTTPFDALCDVLVADGLRTVVLRPLTSDTAESSALRSRIWRDPRVVLGASDTGAHLDLMATFNFTTAFLGRHARDRGLMELEEAVHRITDVQARLWGLRGRGRVAEGYHADLVVFDPERIGPGPVSTRSDLPGGAARLYGESEGIERVLVGGVEIMRAGALTGARPGRVLRSGRDTDTVTLTGS
jgi:N-acyl-D-aspartate/D-glutamate deacylase